MSTPAPKREQMQTIRAQVEAQARALFRSLKPELAERCWREFTQAAMEVEHRRQGVRPLHAGEGKEGPGSSSSTLDSHQSRSLPSVTKKLSSGSYLLTPATESDIMGTISRIGIAFGLRAIADVQQRAIARTMIAEGWTHGEVFEAGNAISADPELGRQIGFDQTVTPAVFAMARKTFRVMRGRLHDYETVRKMAEDNRRPLREMCEPVHLEATQDDGVTYLITKWQIK